MEYATGVDPVSLILSLGGSFLSRELGFPQFDLFNINTWFDPNVWFGFGRGLDDWVKTLVTGGRLARSTVPLVTMLGLHFAELARQHRILSRQSDIEEFFGPAIAYTAGVLAAPGPQLTPELAGEHLNNVIFGGREITGFDRFYFNQKPYKPTLLTEEQYRKQRPDKRFPPVYYRHLVAIANKLSGQPPNQPCGCTPQPRSAL
jgi:hypothetical protein